MEDKKELPVKPMSWLEACRFFVKKHWCLWRKHPRIGQTVTIEGLKFEFKKCPKCKIMSLEADDTALEMIRGARTWTLDA